MVKLILLVKEQKILFQYSNMPDVKFVFSVKGKDTNAVAITPDQTYHLKKFIKDTSQPDQLLKTYTGIYYCPELDCKYGIVLKNHRLVLTNDKYDDAELTLIGTDHLINDYWWMNHLMMITK